MTNSTLLWTGFGLFVVTVMVLDLGVFHRKAHAVSLREAAIWTTFDVAAGAFAGEGFKVPNDARRDALGSGSSQDCLRQRVLATGLQGRGDAQHVGRRMIVQRDHVADLGNTLGQRPGLVEGNRLQPARLFQMDAAFDEHALSSCTG